MLSEREEKFRNSRGFDEKGRHENGTLFDDEGYDWTFRNAAGRVRLDKVPPYKGAYILAVLAAVKAAADMAYRTMADGGHRYVETPDVVIEPVECIESLIGEDYDAPMQEFWGSRGVIVITDVRDGIGNYHCGYTFWDEATGQSRMDDKDFPHALSQIGSSILEDLGKDDTTDDSSLFLARLARLLMTEDLWEDGPDAWCVEGLHDKALAYSKSDIEGWDDSLEEQIRKADRSQNEEWEDSEIPF